MQIICFYIPVKQDNLPAGCFERRHSIYIRHSSLSLIVVVWKQLVRQKFIFIYI